GVSGSPVRLVGSSGAPSRPERGTGIERGASGNFISPASVPLSVSTVAGHATTGEICSSGAGKGKRQQHVPALAISGQPGQTGKQTCRPAKAGQLPITR